MKLRYFSHSAFQVTTETGQRILIDPFLDGNPTSPVGAEDVHADFRSEERRVGKECRL